MDCHGDIPKAYRQQNKKDREVRGCSDWIGVHKKSIVEWAVIKMEKEIKFLKENKPVRNLSG